MHHRSRCPDILDLTETVPRPNHFRSPSTLRTLVRIIRKLQTYGKDRHGNRWEFRSALLDVPPSLGAFPHPKDAPTHKSQALELDFQC